MSTLSAMGKAFLSGYGSTQNYSVLFNSLNSNSSKSFNMFDVSGKSSASNLSTNFYSDYASLKNGSYGKLAKTWYAKQSTDTSEKSTDYSELASTISEKKFPIAVCLYLDSCSKAVLSLLIVRPYFRSVDDLSSFTRSVIFGSSGQFLAVIGTACHL